MNGRVFDERDSSMGLIRGGRRGARTASGAALALAFSLVVVGCAGKKRDFGPSSDAAGATTGIPADETTDDSEAVAVGQGGSSSTNSEVGDEGTPVAVGLAPAVSVGDEASASCDADSGACGDAGVDPVCVPAARDCSSEVDNDCDGQPDNVVDDVCLCVTGAVEACEEHPGFDGQGNCHAGVHTCLFDPATLTTSWSECEGSVGPGEQDSCVPADDTDCDGTPNEGCSCTEGQTQPCGSTTNIGPCQVGTSTCEGGTFQECVGGVSQSLRDSCTVRGDDSNCNGIPNDECSCIDGETRPCGPSTDAGICQRGTQTCSGGVFGGECVGAVFARPRNCGSQQDNDCDGRPDNTVDNVCRCSIGSTRACQTHPGLDGIGRCQPGRQTCVVGANNSSSDFGACIGSVGPAQRDACTSINDDNCDGFTNDGCQCVSSRGNADCSATPDAARCNGATGQCVACQSNADCSLVLEGRSLCQAGRCVAPIRPLGESCAAGNQCESGVCDLFYRDNDRDSYAPEGAVAESFCSAVGFTKTQYTRLAPTNVRNTDCLDTAIDVNPGQAAFFADPAPNGTYDYNCDGDEERNRQAIVNDAECFADGADGSCTATGIAEDVGCGEVMVATNCIRQGATSCRTFFADGIGARRCR